MKHHAVCSHCRVLNEHKGVPRINKYEEERGRKRRSHIDERGLSHARGKPNSCQGQHRANAHVAMGIPRDTHVCHCKQFPHISLLAVC